MACHAEAVTAVAPLRRSSDMMKVQSAIDVFVQMGKSGRPVYEQLLVESERRGLRLLKSPGLVLGLAAGDLFEVDHQKAPRVIERGGNICVQVFSREPGLVEPLLTARFVEIGGRLDGRSHKELVYTVPVTAGFTAIEKALEQPDAVIEWIYGNVFDPVDGVTPLDWWKGESE